MLTIGVARRSTRTRRVGVVAGIVNVLFFYIAVVTATATAESPLLDAAGPGLVLVWNHTFASPVMIPDWASRCQNYIGVGPLPGTLTYIQKDTGGLAPSHIQEGASGQTQLANFRERIILGDEVFECRCAEKVSQMQLPKDKGSISWLDKLSVSYPGAGQSGPTEYALWFTEYRNMNFAGDTLVVPVNGTKPLDINLGGTTLDPNAGTAHAGDIVTVRSFTANTLSRTYQLSSGRELWGPTKYRWLLPMVTDFRYIVFNVNFTSFFVLPYPGTKAEVEKSRPIPFPTNYSYTAYSAPDDIVVFRAYTDDGNGRPTTHSLYAINATNPNKTIWSANVSVTNGVPAPSTNIYPSVVFSSCSEIPSLSGIIIVELVDAMKPNRWRAVKYHYETGAVVYSITFDDAAAIQVEAYCRVMGNSVVDSFYGTYASSPQTVFRKSQRLSAYTPPSAPPVCPTEPPATPTPSPTSSGPADNKLSIGAIVGAAIGGSIVIGLVVWVGVRYHHKKMTSNSAPVNSDDVHTYNTV